MGKEDKNMIKQNKMNTIFEHLQKIKEANKKISTKALEDDLKAWKRSHKKN